jgi:flagellar biosynthesis protein FliQ
MLKAKLMRKQTKIVVVSAAISLLLIASVGFALSSAPNAGTYISSITLEDIPASIPTAAKAMFIGEWMITLAEDRGYRIAKNGQALVEGHFVSSAEQIKFTDEAGDLACTQASGMRGGSYEWSYQNHKLTFIPVTDNCEARRFVLGIHPWTQAPTDRVTTIQALPPTAEPTPPEDTERYVAWMEKQGKPITDRPHEDVSLRVGDWGFFYHGDRPVGSWRPLQDRTAVDRSGHAVTETENGDWFALLSTSGLDAASALKRVAWLFNADGLVPTAAPRTARRDKLTAPVITTKEGAITFRGWCEAHSDPPYEMRITIVASAKGTKVIVDR